MSQEQRRRLPQGALLYVSHLPPGTTEQALSNVFAAQGLDVPVEYIEIRRRDSIADIAVVSLPVAAVAKLTHDTLAHTGCRITPLEKHAQRLPAPQLWPLPYVKAIEGKG
jgi:hypothetical protein